VTAREVGRKRQRTRESERRGGGRRRRKEEKEENDERGIAHVQEASVWRQPRGRIISRALAEGWPGQRVM